MGSVHSLDEYRVARAERQLAAALAAGAPVIGAVFSPVADPRFVTVGETPCWVIPDPERS